MSNLENLLNRLTIDVAQSQEHYVHYDKNTNQIHKISPINQKSKFEIFSIDSKIVEPILKGIARLDDFVVYFDYKLKKLNIKRKASSSFTNISLIEVKEIESADVTICIDNKYVKISACDNLLEHLKNDRNNLIFVITKKDNPYNLHYTFNIQACNILENISVEHQITAEEIQNGVSIYTNPVFETYTLKVNYDTEISPN